MDSPTWQQPSRPDIDYRLTIVGHYYDSTGTLTKGPVAASDITVNSAPELIPEPNNTTNNVSNINDSLNANLCYDV